MESNFKISRNEHIYKPLDIFDDRATKNKIYRHLVDINDTISEEDLRNIKVTISDMGNVSHHEEEVIDKNRSITPWDVLDIEA